MTGFGRKKKKERRWRGRRLLADEKHIYRAEVEVIVEGERRKTVVCRVLARIELQMW